MAVKSIDFARNNTQTANTDRGPTPAVWSDCPVLEIIENPNEAVRVRVTITPLPARRRKGGRA